jgi:hypothetical protein
MGIGNAECDREWGIGNADGALFVTRAGDDNHGQRQTVFTDVFQERYAVAVV